MLKSALYAAAAVTLLSTIPAGAAMSPQFNNGASPLVRVDCAAGFHIGPVGTCIIGTDDRAAPPVVERRGADEGCDTKTVKRTDSDGNSETHTRTNCD